MMSALIIQAEKLYRLTLMFIFNSRISLTDMQITNLREMFNRRRRRRLVIITTTTTIDHHHGGDDVRVWHNLTSLTTSKLIFPTRFGRVVLGHLLFGLLLKREAVECHSTTLRCCRATRIGESCLAD